MKTYLECVPCFVRQALDASRMAGPDPAVHERVLRETLRLAAEMRFDRSPPWMGQQIHRLLRDATGDPDPYREVKARSNALALSLYPGLKRQVASSADAFEAAVRLAIAGNVIDFGCGSRITEDQIRRSIEDATRDPIDDEAVAALRQAVSGASDVLYLADNAGEIVLDRLLIEELPVDRVTVVVRGGPVINDATRADAEAAGLTDLVSVMDNGADVPGTILAQCSPAFRERFARSDLVIAKGQGNYETLSDAEREIFFLLKAKCPVIAQDIGCEIGQIVVCHGRGTRRQAEPEAGVRPGERSR